MANDTFQILRSSVPLLRPLDRCPGELFVNFADRIFGYIDAAGVARDVGPLVFLTVADLAAYDAAIFPRDGTLAFAADAFYLKEAGGTAPGLPGWRELALGGGGYDDTALRALIAAETAARIAGDLAVEANSDAGDAALNARITSESTARADGDTALASQVTTLTATVTDNDTALNARVTNESTARVDGDTALATRIDNIEAGGGTDLTEVNARITAESLARVQGDDALALRSDSLEVFRTDAQQSGGNLLQNALLSQGSEPWDFLGANGWVVEPRDVGGAAFVLVTRAPGTVLANGSVYLPVPSQRLDFEVWVSRDFGTLGGVSARLDLGTVTGQPLASLVVPLTATTGAVPLRLPLSFDLPDGAGLWRLAFVSTVSSGSMELGAPFLGLRGKDFSSEVNSLGARIDAESVARIDGDTALASRSTTLEAFRTSTEQTGGNLIDDATLVLGGASWLLGGWFIAARTDAPAGQVLAVNAGVRTLQANTGLMRAPVLQDFTVRFWMLETPSTTGTGLTAQIRITTRSTPADTVFQTFVVPVTGANLNWQNYAFRCLLPDDATGWRVEFVSNITGGRIELALPFAGVSTGDSSADLEALSARVTDESLARVAGDEALASRSTSLEARATVVEADIVSLTDASTVQSGQITVLNAAVSDESVARVAGDTALASRSTILEAASLQSRSDVQNINFGAYNSLEEMVAAGWTFEPAITHPGLGSNGLAWGLDFAFGDGGQALRFWGTARVVTLTAPMTLVVGNPWQPETHQGSWVLGRDDGGTNNTPGLLVTAGWESFDVDGLRLNTDLGGFSAHVAFSQQFPTMQTVTLRGYTRGMASTGTGANVGYPSPDILNAAPLPSFAARFRPVIQLITEPFDFAPLFLSFLRVDYRRVSNERATRASITNESTVRASADNALALQIQQIIATEAQGTQTFYQANPPANPEPGWLWFQDTGPGVPDNIFRWSGIAWVRIDTAQQNDLALLQAQITDESFARVAGDAALAQRTTTLEATAISQGNAIGSNTSGLTAANARITDESVVRASGDSALATRATTTETTVDGLSARVTTSEQSIDGIEARYSITVNAQGRIAGISLLAGGNASLFDILADAFRVFNPIAGTSAPVFEVVGGRTFIREAYIPLLGTSSLKIDDVVFDTNAQGELTILQQGITTRLLGQNAAVRPHTFFAQGNWTVTPRNVWVDAQMNGAPATLTITNTPTATGFLEIVLVFGASNAGNSGDAMGFRISRSDGVILTLVYTNVDIGETFGRNDMTTLHFFDEGVPAGATLTYTLQVISNDGTFVRSITMLGKLFKNSSSATGASA